MPDKLYFSGGRKEAEDGFQPVLPTLGCSRVAVVSCNLPPERASTVTQESAAQVPRSCWEQTEGMPRKLAQPGALVVSSTQEPVPANSTAALPVFGGRGGGTSRAHFQTNFH